MRYNKMAEKNGEKEMGTDLNRYMHNGRVAKKRLSPQTDVTHTKPFQVLFFLTLLKSRFQERLANPLQVREIREILTELADIIQDNMKRLCGGAEGEKSLQVTQI